ncbi:type I restriction endonuclease [Desulfobacterales bacterium HSG17]|nr:type I restriction endonuclease [Desulfobacterales bacterium HSG17]
MLSQTNEQALESAIEKALTGTCLEELKTSGSELYYNSAAYGGNGFHIGYADDFNSKYAIDETRFWDFLQSSQKDELEKLKRSSDWKLKILERFDRMVRKYGVIRLLRKGLELEDAQFSLLYPLPLASSSQRIKDDFASNQFSVTRQVRYNPENPHEEIDMVLFINGIPIATLELKNQWTGQNARVHGRKQYNDRDMYHLN